VAQSEYGKIFNVVASDLARGPTDVHFLDARAGLACTIAWANSAINQLADAGDHELALQYLEKCRVILDLVKDHGWTVVTKRVAIEHVAAMRIQPWK